MLAAPQISRLIACRYLSVVRLPRTDCALARGDLTNRCVRDARERRLLTAYSCVCEVSLHTSQVDSI